MIEISTTTISLCPAALQGSTLRNKKIKEEMKSKRSRKNETTKKERIRKMFKNENIIIKGLIKGSVSRDFLPPVFFMIQTHLGP